MDNFVTDQMKLIAIDSSDAILWILIGWKCNRVTIMGLLKTHFLENQNLRNLIESEVQK